MRHSLRTLVISGAATALLGGFGGAAPIAAAATGGGTGAGTGTGTGAGTGTVGVLHVGQIDRQDVPSRGGCEPDTLVEPDVAVSPVNPKIMVAAAHDCRFSTGAAVDISYAWTHDGGAHWHHAPLPKLTRAVGGAWARASDPVVAFGADGSVYISSLVIDFGCSSGVAVSRSTDGGATFGPPVLAHKSTSCNVSDDKNWLVTDTQPESFFYGRIYQFWTEFRRNGAPQVVRWSDDRGRHWSGTHVVSPANHFSQDSQPMVQPDGTVVDVYLRSPFPIGNDMKPGPLLPQGGQAAGGVTLVAQQSNDGGAHWSGRSAVATNIGGGPAGIRCCLPLASSDAKTGRLFAVWITNGPGGNDLVKLAASGDGQTWSRPVRVTPDRPHTQYINPAVAASGGRVFVSFGAIDTAAHGGNLVQQEFTWAREDLRGGFSAPVGLGPPSNLKYAAVAGGKFPGDYTGLSATPARVTAAWCVSSKPPNPAAVYHQVLYAGVLRP